ncbi:MAG: S-methyl-5-thioribose-1-phosphate isomerase [Deltaproteobacteria bacterium]|nr:S-methyl-5-thioribose-1-phosphate isomerase [Deltaproteobacteria bacterium]
MNFFTLQWQDGSVVMIDQRKLPNEEIYNTYRTPEEVAAAIKTMVIRGAPAIGVAGAFGMALAANNSQAKDREAFFAEMDLVAEMLISQRPTAVNLPWAVRRIQNFYRNQKDTNLLVLQNKILEEALRIFDEDVRMCRQMGENGAPLIEEGKTYLTHCNAGALATAGEGTALSLFYEAQRRGKKFKVIASETRPFLQGARLTAWELGKNGIDVTLVTDNMVGHLMRLGKIDGAVVGSDRIVANGDVANKIGTYGVAVLAKHHGIPLYVVAPSSTVDFDTTDGSKIPIEERPDEEVTAFFGTPSAPAGVKVFNPAFDVTPHELVEAIVTEKGIARAPYSQNLKKVLQR